MYQHTVVSAAPACGVHVPIRSHVPALCRLFYFSCRSNEATAFPNKPSLLCPKVARDSGRAIATSPSLGREDSAVPWASSSARCWAPRGSTLLFVPLRSTESAPRRVMTTIQPILALRHVYEPAVQLRVRRARIALKPLKPHVSIRDDLGPQTAVCTHCKARHWELGPPVFRVFGRLYHRLGALIPAVTQRPTFAQTWLIDPAEATDTRLGPDGADSRMQRSTLTKLESILRTGNRFVREFASAKARAGWDTAREWVLRLCLPPGRDRRTHNLPTSSTEMAMLICDSDTNTGDRGPQDLILQVHGDRCPDGEDGSHPNIPFCGFHQAGPPIARNREQIDNGVQLRELLAGLGPQMKKTNRRTKTATMRMKTARKGTKRMVMVNVSVFRSFSYVPFFSRSQYLAYYLHERGDYFSIPHATQRLFLEFVIDGYSQVETDRLNYIRFHQETLRLTTAQGITDAVDNGLTRIRLDVTQRYRDAMACVVKYGKPSLFITVTCNPDWPEIKAALGPNDQASNRPDLIARVFEAKLNRLCDDVFGNKQSAGCFGVVLTHTHDIECQKRGLPHAHILITLAPDDHPLSTEAIDKMI
ncbi:BQ5605_C015g07824 [Microbotryum silenes-dioicae]|uniref:BQ5605_C015g07824 protein n=1 Tax=Microbotryum silenes-dioicae TaxID=796604 RepID=A0A2X0MMM6_9BASI|nr:BQ5605_C015g07824 [Microbotryum silenes-dioicae]